MKKRATYKRAWVMNNNNYQSMSKGPQSMVKVTKCLIKIFDAKYENADLRSIIKNDCNKHRGAPKKALLLELLEEFEELFDGHEVTGIANQFLLTRRKE